MKKNTRLHLDRMDRTACGQQGARVLLGEPMIQGQNGFLYRITPHGTLVTCQRCLDAMRLTTKGDNHEGPTETAVR